MPISRMTSDTHCGWLQPAGGRPAASLQQPCNGRQPPCTTYPSQHVVYISRRDRLLRTSGLFIFLYSLELLSAQAEAIAWQSLLVSFFYPLSIPCSNLHLTTIWVSMHCVDLRIAFSHLLFLRCAEQMTNNEPQITKPVQQRRATLAQLKCIRHAPAPRRTCV